MDNMTGGNKMEHEQHSSINDILHHYKEGIGSFTNQIPEIAETYNAFTQACFQEGALTKREKQLIALGISLATQDEYCTIYHTKGCLDQGCSDKEIRSMWCFSSICWRSCDESSGNFSARVFNRTEKSKALNKKRFKLYV